MDPITAALGLAQFGAPLIARWLGGKKAGETAQRIVDSASALTGHSELADIKQALTADPALFARFQGDMMRLDAELEEKQLADRADARARDMGLRKLGRANYRADILALGAFITLAGLVSAMLFIPLPSGGTRDLLMLLAGALVAIVKDVYAFEFGSSRGSKEKQTLLSALGR
jgi:hypothetical protein